MHEYQAYSQMASLCSQNVIVTYLRAKPSPIYQDSTSQKESHRIGYTLSAYPGIAMNMCVCNLYTFEIYVLAVAGLHI
jgi:hypothetical protein